MAVGMIGSTLRTRPKLQAPKSFSPVYQRDDFQKTLAQLNGQLLRVVSTNSIGIPEEELAPRASNLQIARRISLALVGSGMSLEEVRAFQAIREGDQIRWWTSYLLRDRRWADYFAQRFSRAFVGTSDGPFLLFRRWKFNRWLADGFHEGKGYDQLVRSMISAEGLWTDTPPVNFVTAAMDETDLRRADPIRLAGRTSRAFLAQRMDCLQCHNDYLGNIHFGTSDEPMLGTQENFHEFAAFYAGTTLPKLLFRGIIDDGKGYHFEFLGEAEAREVLPEVPFATELLPSTGKPRDRLATWVTHVENRAFARAVVNRVWALMFARPLVEPVDNIPLNGEVPEALDTLADDFRKHGFDIRRLVRLIVECDAFQRDSKADFEITEGHEQLWAVFPLSQMRPDQVVSGIFQSNRLTTINNTSSIVTRLEVFGETIEFMRLFGDRGEDEFQSDAVTIPQRLIMMNGKIVEQRTGVDLVMNAPTRIGSLVKNDKKAVELAFLSTLNRVPLQAELDVFTGFLAGKKGESRNRAMGDIFWAIWNSTEFSWNH